MNVEEHPFDGDAPSADQQPATFAAARPDGRGPVPVALLPAGEAVPAAVWDIAELRYVHVDHRSGPVVLGEVGRPGRGRLGHAAVHGLFVEADLASILDHHTGRPCSGRHQASEERSLTQGTAAWSRLGTKNSHDSVDGEVA